MMANLVNSSSIKVNNTKVPTSLSGTQQLQKIPIERNNSVITTTRSTNGAKMIAPQTKISFGWTFSLFTINIILFIVGVAGNALTVLTIVKNKSMQTLQNYLVFNLALTDLFTLIVVLPLAMLTWYTTWPFGEFACKYLLPICDIVPPVSILTLVAISIDRYRAIAITLARSPSLNLGIIFIIFLWVACYLVVGLPVSFVLKLHQNYCFPVFTDTRIKQTYYTLRTIGLYILPSIIIFVCYLRVNKVLKTSVRFLQRSVTGKSQVIRLKRQKHVMSMFFAIFVTFELCFLPIHVYVIFLSYIPNPESMAKYNMYIVQCAFICGFSNSVCNPIILYLLSRAYRKSFQTYFPFLTYCRQKDPLRNDWKDNDTDKVIAINNKSYLTEEDRKVGSSNVSLLLSATDMKKEGEEKEENDGYIDNNPTINTRLTATTNFNE